VLVDELCSLYIAICSTAVTGSVYAYSCSCVSAAIVFVLTLLIFRVLTTHARPYCALYNTQVFNRDSAFRTRWRNQRKEIRERIGVLAKHSLC
jgi:hypothetical protein